MTRGNRVVLPPPYSAMERNGAQEKNDNRPRRSMSAAACCRSTKKGRHIAGPVSGEWGLVSDFCDDYFTTTLEWNIAIARAARGKVFISYTAIERAFNGLYNGVFNIGPA